MQADYMFAVQKPEISLIDNLPTIKEEKHEHDCCFFLTLINSKVSEHCFGLGLYLQAKTDPEI